MDWCKPYKDFLNSRTIPSIASGSKSWSPSSIFMQFGLSRSEPTNALDASSMWARSPYLAAKAIKIQRLSSQKTSANISSKSSSDCSFPLATNLALNLSIWLSRPNLTLNTHQVDEIVPSALSQQMMFQVPKLIKVLNSLWITSHHLDPYTGLLTASLYDFGSCILAFSHTAHASSLTLNSQSSISNSVAIASLAHKCWAG